MHDHRFLFGGKRQTHQLLRWKKLYLDNNVTETQPEIEGIVGKYPAKVLLTNEKF